MECKWLLEKEKIVVKNEKSGQRGIIIAYGTVLLLFAIMLFLAYKNSPDHWKEGLGGICGTFVFILIIITVTLFIKSRQTKKVVANSTTLRQELEKALRTSEDYELIDMDVYGGLKRKVGLGKNDFTFTPHFLIQKFSEVDYKVIKLQNVSYIKTFAIVDYAYTEFFDEFDESLGKIKNTEYDCRVFNEICQEQIPWAELKED